MKINATLAATFAGIALVAVALTGCTPPPDNEGNEFDDSMPEPAEYAHYTTHIDQSTGRIVKITEGWSNSGEDTQPDTTLYADPALEAIDPALLVETTTDRAPMQDPNPSGYTASTTESQFVYGIQVVVKSTVQINGKPYPVETLGDGTVSLTNLDDAVAYYNELIAKPTDNSAPPMPSINLAESIKSHARNEAAAQLLANITYEPYGSLTIKQDSGIASDAANGVPAWQAYRTHIAGNTSQQGYYPKPPEQTNSNPSPQGSQAYAYSYACATYEVSISNVEGTIQLTDAALNERIDITSLSSKTPRVLVDTAEACTVIEYTPSN